MAIEIVSESVASLAEYARVPSAFLVSEIFDEAALDAMDGGHDGAPTPIPIPYWKDYDAYLDSSPTGWAARFDVSAWKLFAAYRRGQRIGGAVLIVGASAIDLLDGRADLALLWDLRVLPDARRLGVGRALVEAVASAARHAGAAALRVETQNVNVPACRFYRACDFRLEQVRHGAYEALPDELQLLWTRRLTPTSRAMPDDERPIRCDIQ